MWKLRPLFFRGGDDDKVFNEAVVCTWYKVCMYRKPVGGNIENP